MWGLGFRAPPAGYKYPKSRLEDSQPFGVLWGSKGKVSELRLYDLGFRV